jgi:hypothetical protein
MTAARRARNPACGNPVKGAPSIASGCHARSSKRPRISPISAFFDSVDAGVLVNSQSPVDESAGDGQSPATLPISRGGQ